MKERGVVVVAEGEECIERTCSWAWRDTPCSLWWGAEAPGRTDDMISCWMNGSDCITP